MSVVAENNNTSFRLPCPARLEDSIFLEHFNNTFLEAHLANSRRFLKCFGNFTDNTDNSCKRITRWSAPSIFFEIEKKLRSTTCRPLKILEIGPGPSYYGSYHFGPPHFSRALKYHFGDRVEILLADANDKDFGFALIENNQDSLAISTFPESKYTFLPLSNIDRHSKLAEPLDPLKLDLLDKKFNWFSKWHTLKFDENSTSHFIRPLYDSELEESLFALKRVGRININDYYSTTLLKKIEPAGFDIIYSLNFPPLTNTYFNPLITNNLELLLAPLGKALLAYDPSCETKIRVITRNF